MDPHQRLSRRGYWVWQLTQHYAADPTQGLRQRYSHDSSLLTLYSCRPRVTFQARHLGSGQPMLSGRRGRRWLPAHS